MSYRSTSSDLTSLGKLITEEAVNLFYSKPVRENDDNERETLDVAASDNEAETLDVGVSDIDEESLNVVISKRENTAQDVAQLYQNHDMPTSNSVDDSSKMKEEKPPLATSRAKTGQRENVSSPSHEGFFSFFGASGYTESDLRSIASDLSLAAKSTYSKGKRASGKRNKKHRKKKQLDIDE